MSPVELNTTHLGKKRRHDKRKEKEVEESKEEGRRVRRRSGRLAKSNAKSRLKARISQQEEADLEDTGCPKWRMKEKVSNFGVGRIKEKEEVSYSSQFGLREGMKENKKIRLGCVDLTRD